MKIEYKGIKNGRFEYSIELNGHSFEYFTGLGWSKVSHKKPIGFKALSELETQLVINNVPFSYNRTMNGARIWRQVPTESDVLECLKVDAEAGKMSFDEFCENFGYSNDSLKALDVYRACLETVRKLKGFEFPKEFDSEA